MRDLTTLQILKERKGNWCIAWHGNFLRVHTRFLTKGPYMPSITLPYYDWKMLAFSMEKVSYERFRSKKGRALWAIGITKPPAYISSDDRFEIKGSPKAKEFYQKRLRLSAKDVKTGLRRSVAVDFGQSSITFTRHAYAQFESDVLEADQKLNRLIQKFKQARKARKERDQLLQ